MVGYLYRNANGVKEIREGDVQPPFKMNYTMRHAGGRLLWNAWWERGIKWDTAKVIRIHPGLYWAFPDEGGKIEYAMYGGLAIPTNIAPIITMPIGWMPDRFALHRRFERMLWTEDAGYRERRKYYEP